MTGRNLQPGDTTQKPGPGAHSPEKVSINRNKAARYVVSSMEDDKLVVLFHSMSGMEVVEEPQREGDRTLFPWL